MRTALACAEPVLAERLTDGLELLTPLHDHALCAARAALAEARGEQAQAAELYAEAAERWREFGNVHECGHALLGQGRCLLASNQPNADDALREARRIFTGLGARPLLAEIDALRDRAGALPSSQS